MPTRKLFREQLGGIGRDLATMTNLAAAALRGASVALLEAQMTRAHEVTRGVAALNRLQREVEARAVDLLARQQPVAGDLRLLVAALRMNADLERMAGLAVHLADIAGRRHPDHAIPADLSAPVAWMAADAAELADRASHLIAGDDFEAAAAFEDRDETIDRLHRELLAALLDPAAGYSVQTAIDVTLVGRYYERFADHAVSIARGLEFVLVGDPADAVR
jgi:phosphate transport system protein